MRQAFAALALFVVTLVSASSARALEVPALTGRVNDGAGMLTPAQANALEQKLAAYEQKTGQQFVLLTVPSLEGDPIEDFAIRVAERWKIGRKGKDDGLIMVIAAQDRKMRIEVGYGLEGDIPDAYAAQVIRNIMTPAFRAGAYAEGIERAFDALIARASGEPPPEGVVQRDPRTHAPRSVRLFPMLMVIVLIILFSGGGRGGRGRRRTVPFFIPMGGGHGGFGGGGGGGFGGGGGRFGGGGASGGW